jgi:hypothetical protein
MSNDNKNDNMNSNSNNNENENENNQENREIVNQVQRFTVSSISMLNLLQTACERQEFEKLEAKDQRSLKRFMDSSKKFIDSMKDITSDFDYTRFIKKAFSTLRSEEQCDHIQKKNPKIFEIRDSDNRIITILPGIDIKYGYKFLDQKEIELFWQYMYLFTSSVFRIIKPSNAKKFVKYPYLNDTLIALESELAKTGIMFSGKIFNPYIGVGDNTTNYAVSDMFTGGPLPEKQTVSIDSVLSMLGVDKMFDENKLNEELKKVGEEQVSEATEKIAGLLGATNNPEVKEVCNVLIKDIVENFKENGISNIGETLKKVADKAKMNIEVSKMKKTAESMKSFMNTSQEKMKDMKDSNGNPIGQKFLDSMSVPMSMMNMMTKNMPAELKNDKQ